jgi:hypothetical protein
MTLSRATATLVVEIVSKDPECRRRIDDAFFSKFGTLSGSFRNGAFCVANLLHLEKCAPDGQQQKKICYGIAEATVEAINKVCIRPPNTGTLSSVKFAQEIGRNVGESGEHYATKLVLRHHETVSGGAFDVCVFDWWSTLKSNDPLIYKSASEFMNASGGIVFSQYSG